MGVLALPYLYLQHRHQNWDAVGYHHFGCRENREAVLQSSSPNNVLCSWLNTVVGWLCKTPSIARTTRDTSSKVVVGNLSGWVVGIGYCSAYWRDEH